MTCRRCHNLPKAGAPLLIPLMSLAFLALMLGIDASISDASGMGNTHLGLQSATQPTHRRLLQLQAAPRVRRQRTAPVKYKSTSSGDEFYISSDILSDDGGFSFLSLSGYNSLSINSDTPTPTPTTTTYISIYSCQPVELIPGNFTLACSDTWGYADGLEGFKLSLDPKSMSATASATFQATKHTYNYMDDDTYTTVSVSYNLKFPCVSANITKRSSKDTCSYTYRSTEQPTFHSTSNYRSGGTQCAISTSSITGSILVDGVDLLSTWINNPAGAGASSSASTSTSKYSSIYISKTFLF